MDTISTWQVVCPLIYIQVVFGDINPTAGAATEQELAEKYGKDNVRFLQCDVTDGSKFEGIQWKIEREEKLHFISSCLYFLTAIFTFLACQYKPSSQMTHLIHVWLMTDGLKASPVSRIQIRRVC